MAAIVSNGTGGGNWVAGASWNGGVAPGVGDTAQILNGDTITQTQNEACDAITVDNGGTLDIATFNLDVGGLSTFNGTWTMGTSAGTGLTTAGITAAITATLDFQQGSVINNSSNLSLADNLTITNNYRGTYTQTDDGNGLNPDMNFWDFTLDATKTLTATGTLRLSSAFSNDVTINGIIAVNGNTVIMGGDGVLTFGANCDFTGAGTINTFFETPGTFVNNKVGAFSLTGTLISSSGGTTRRIPTADWSNANFQINYSSLGVTTQRFEAGTMKCINFTITNSRDINSIVDCATNDPNFEISGNINFDAGAGVYDIVWNKGTGTITLTGTSGTQTLDFDGRSIEDLIVNHSGTSKQLTANVISDSLTLTTGKFDVQTYDVTMVGGATNIGGDFVMGSSSNTGLVTAAFACSAGSTVDLQIDSIISNSNLFTIHNSAIWVNPARGEYTQTVSNNASNPNANNYFYKFTVNNGVTLTSAVHSYYGRDDSDSMIINGVLAQGGQSARIGCNNVLTFGVNSDITGSGTFDLHLGAGVTYTNNKVGAFGLTGIMFLSTSGATSTLITGDWSNASLYLTGGTQAQEFVTVSGTLKIKELLIQNANNFNVTITNSTNNPSFEISDDVDLNGGAGTYNTIWTKGTGNITLTGSSGTQTIDWNSQTVEDIIINASGATKQMITACTTDSFLGTAGTINHNGQDMTTTGNYTLAAAMLNNRTGLNGMTLTVGGNYTVNGSAVNQIRLDATAGWTLNVTGTGTATYVDVRNSDASGGSTITADDNTSSDLGSNLNWDFLPAGMEIQSTMGLVVSPALY